MSNAEQIRQQIVNNLLSSGVYGKDIRTLLKDADEVFKYVITGETYGANSSESMHKLSQARQS